jgi:hypothetical protein
MFVREGRPSAGGDKGGTYGTHGSPCDLPKITLASGNGSSTSQLARPRRYASMRKHNEPGS